MTVTGDDVANPDIVSPAESDVESIPDAVRAYRRAAQWLAHTARRDQAGLDRLKESIGPNLAEWVNLVSTLACIAEEQGVARLGTPGAWAEHADNLAATAYAIEAGQAALGALADQVQAQGSRAERRRRQPGRR
jgi:hypothetical protein